MKVVRRVANQAMKTTVRDLMAKSIISGDPRQSLVAAAAQMRAHRISALVVLDGEAIVGILTERNLLRAIADGRTPDIGTRILARIADGIAYRAVNLSKYEWKNASRSSLGVCNPSGGLPNTITLWFFPSYTGHLLSPFPFGSPVLAKFTQ